MESMSESLQQILKENPALVINDNGRVKCTLTKHEMPCKEKVVLQHISAKKYKRLSKLAVKPFNFDDYSQWLMPCKEKIKKYQLECKLTQRYVNNAPDHILRHVNGKRFKAAKERWLKCQETGEKFIPLPVLEQKRRIEKQKAIEAEIKALEEMSDSDGEFEEIIDEIPDKKNKNGNAVEKMDDEPCTSAAVKKQGNGSSASTVEDQLKAVINSGKKPENNNGKGENGEVKKGMQKRKNRGKGQKQKAKKMKN